MKGAHQQLAILLLTGDMMMMRRFRQLLTPIYTLLVAGTLAEGIELGHGWLPDLVLCDSVMNDISGYQFLITLRLDPVLRDTPFILFSRPNMPVNMRKGMNLGADDYLVAPFSGEELLKCIQSRLNRFYHIKDTPAHHKELHLENAHVETAPNLNILERLSKTEATILSMISRGMCSRHIAACKCISIRTVDNHRHHITKKLQLSGPNALIKFAMCYASAITSHYLVNP
jgi:DNA-binding NarL/FixJ family response regulator